MTKKRPHFLAAVLLLACACTGLRQVERTRPGDLAWPVNDPRVQLDSVVSLNANLNGRAHKALYWLVGEETHQAFRRPYAIAWDGDDLILADPDEGRLARIQPNGKLTLSSTGVVAYPIGVAVCKEGIVVTDSRAGRVALLSPKMVLQRWLAEDLDRPTGVACNESAIVIAETGRHRLVVLGEDAEPRYVGRRGAGPGEFNYPTALAIDGASIWVGDTLNFRIQRLDLASGRPLSAFGHLGDAPGETPRVKGLAMDPEGHLWVSDAHLDRVSLYTRDGSLLLSLGGTGSGPGQFSFPAGLAARNDGTVAVVDSLNRRVELFSLLQPSQGGAE